MPTQIRVSAQVGGCPHRTPRTSAVATAPSHRRPCPWVWWRQRPSTILVPLVPRASLGDAGGLLGLGMGFAPLGPKTGLGDWGTHRVPALTVSGLVAEPAGALSRGCGERGRGGPGGSSIRNAAAPNVTSRGAAAPQRGRLSPAAGGARGCRSGLGWRRRGRGPRGHPHRCHLLPAGRAAVPRRHRGAQRVGGEGTDPAWRCAGATRVGRRAGLGDAVTFKVTPRMAEASPVPPRAPGRRPPGEDDADAASGAPWPRAAGRRGQRRAGLGARALQMEPERRVRAGAGGTTRPSLTAPTPPCATVLKLRGPARLQPQIRGLVGCGGSVAASLGGGLAPTAGPGAPPACRGAARLARASLRRHKGDFVPAATMAAGDGVAATPGGALPPSRQVARFFGGWSAAIPGGLKPHWDTQPPRAGGTFGGGGL